MSTLNSFKPTDLYAILYDIADSMPLVVDNNGTELQCKRLQTVAVVKNYAAEVQTANLGKDTRYIDKKLFFSRASNNDANAANGLKFGYPAFFLGEQDESFSRDGSKYDIDYSIAISDRCEQAQGDNFNQSLCQQRTYEEVAQDLRDIWQSIVRTLHDYIYADLYIGSTLYATGWYSLGGIEELISLNAITHYDEISNLSHFLGISSEGRLSFDVHTESTVTLFLELKVSFFNCAAPIKARPQDMIVVPIVPTDPDAQAYLNQVIAQGGTVGAAQAEATNAAVIALKATALWNKAYALYFMIGGTANAHALNAKAPIVSPANYTLAFTGGWAHSATGAKPNGLNAYANTFFTPSLNASLTSISISYYSADSNTGAHIEMGAGGGATAGSGQLYIAPNVSGINFRAVNTTANYSSALNLNTAAMFTAARIDAATFRLHRNATLVAQNTGLPNTASNRTIYVGARNNNGTADGFSTRQCRFAGIFEGLTAAEAVDLYNIIQSFQATQGRSV